MPDSNQSSNPSIGTEQQPAGSGVGPWNTAQPSGATGPATSPATGANPGAADPRMGESGLRTNPAANNPGANMASDTSGLSGSTGGVSGSTGSERAGGAARQSATEQARAIWQDAKETARSGLGEYKHTTAKGIGDLATALRSSARELESSEQATVARFARSAADGLQQLSGALDRRDLDGLVREAESFARRQPLAFFAGAMAVGFLAVRFIKSTSQHER